MTRLALSTLPFVLLCSIASAETVSIDAAAFDRWMYPFNGTPGVRGTASTFGALDPPVPPNPPAFDERDGQFILGFDLAGQLPTLQPGQRYQVNSARVTATHSIGVFQYDPTYDSFQTYNGTATDADAGRPISLTGVGLRNGFTAFALNAGIAGPPFFEEGESFSPLPAPIAGTRNAFAAAFDPNGMLIDVSNNIGVNGVTAGFDFQPFAVGQTDLDPGDEVLQANPGTSPGSTFTFDIDLSDDFIRGYIEDGIVGQQLFFAITSLHATTQQGGINPNFYTADNFDPASISPTLTLDVTAVPEPNASMAIGGACLAFFARRRRRTRRGNADGSSPSQIR